MRMIRPRLLLLLLAAHGVAAGAPGDEAGLDALEQLLGRQKSADAELIAAIDTLGRALAGLDGDAAQFREKATAALLRALLLERVDGATKRNLRNGVQLAAARALRHAGPDQADRVMRALERRILKDRGYDVDPSFHEAVLEPLVRWNAKGTFEWVLERVVNPDTDPDSRDQALAGLDALLSLPATGEQRRLAMNRILGIYQSYMFHVEDDQLEIAGFRGTSMKYRFMVGAGPYWEAMRPTVMRALRQLSTDPRTGLPPLDASGSEPGTLERYQVWFAQNGLAGRSPWTDGVPAPRAREDASPTRQQPPAWYALGVPWTEAWQRSRAVLDRPLPDAAWRDELSAKTLPPLAAKALEDPAWQVRAAAAVTLGRIRAPDAAALLRQRVGRDPEERVREAAVLGLLLLADEGQRDFLRAGLEDPAENPRLRAYAALALGFLKDRDPLVALVAPNDLGACAVRALGLAGAPPAALLEDRKAAPEIRAEVGAALLDGNDPGVMPQVLKALRDPGAATSAAIAAGLAPADDAKTVRRLAREMGDTDEKFAGVRTLLSASVARMGGGRGAQALAEEWRNLRPNSLRVVERGHFLLALGRVGERELLHAELESLDHDSDLAACALGLALAGERTALATLRAMLRERTDVFAPHGMMALALLGDPGGGPPIREALRRRRTDAVIGEGALALAILEGGKSLPDLLALSERARRPEHHDALAWAFRLAATPDAIAPLRGIVEGKGEPVERAFALMALGRMADPAAPLHRLARGSNPYGFSPTLLDLARWRDAAPLLD